MEVTLNNENFDAEVLRSDTPVLVDFWAEWCVPCRIIAPALTEISEEYRGRVKIGKLNVDEFPDLAMRYQVRGIPNMKIFKAGKLVDELVGAIQKNEILKRMEKHLG